MTAKSREALEEAKKLLFILLGIDITITVVVGFNAFSTIGILKEIASGARVANESLISSLTFWENFSKLLLLTLIGVGFGLVKWLNSCYRFAKDSLGATGFVNKRWTATGWIIPFFNIVKPYQVINEIFKAGAKNYTTTDGWKREAGSGLLLTWWIFWVVTHGILTLVGKQLLKGVTSDHLTPQQAINLTGIHASLCVVSVIIAGLWFVVVTHLTQRLLDRASKSGTPVKAPPEFNVSPITRPVKELIASESPAMPVTSNSASTSQIDVAAKTYHSERSSPSTTPDTTEKISTKTLPNTVSAQSDEEFFAIAFQEVNSGNTVQGLWAKCFAEADGDENKTKARYLSARAGQLGAENAAIQFEAARVARMHSLKAEAEPEIVTLPRGQFVMGSPHHEVGRSQHVVPQHMVRIDYEFAVGK